MDNNGNPHLATSDNGNESVGITSVGLELVFEEGVKVFFAGKVLSHSFGESSSCCLAQSTHLYNLIFTLEYSHFVQKMLQGLDPAIINNLLELLRCDCRPIQVSVQR